MDIIFNDVLFLLLDNRATENRKWAPSLIEAANDFIYIRWRTNQFQFSNLQIQIVNKVIIKAYVYSFDLSLFMLLTVEERGLILTTVSLYFKFLEYDFIFIVCGILYCFIINKFSK